MKVRLIKGPFGGKVMDCREAGSTEIVIRGPKPMTRNQRYEWQVENYKKLSYNYPYEEPPIPTVSARYKLSIRTHVSSGQTFMLACQHPDGSIFYEYVPNSKKEYHY